jgi:hypothetical protein
LVFEAKRDGSRKEFVRHVDDVETTKPEAMWWHGEMHTINELCGGFCLRGLDWKKYVNSTPVTATHRGGCLVGDSSKGVRRSDGAMRLRARPSHRMVDHDLSWRCKKRRFADNESEICDLGMVR